MKFASEKLKIRMSGNSEKYWIWKEPDLIFLIFSISERYLKLYKFSDTLLTVKSSKAYLHSDLSKFLNLSFKNFENDYFF